MLLNAKHRNSKSAKFVADFWGKSLADKDWYAIKNHADGSAEIRIYDVIGWPFIDADSFVSDLNRIQSSDITVAINSPGGDVFDGTAIYNALKSHPAKITTRVDGIAASMASIIALAGDTVEMASNAYYMIHNPWSFSMGDHRDLRKDADLLARIGVTLGEMYVKKTGKSSKEIQSAMDDETWYIGKEAEEFGFVDETIGEADQVVAKFDTGIFSHMPDNIHREDRRGVNDMPTEREIERVLTRDAGLTRAAARQLISNGYSKNVTRDADDSAELTACVNALNATIKGKTS